MNFYEAFTGEKPDHLVGTVQDSARHLVSFESLSTASMVMNLMMVMILTNFYTRLQDYESVIAV